MLRSPAITVGAGPAASRRVSRTSCTGLKRRQVRWVVTTRRRGPPGGGAGGGRGGAAQLRGGGGAEARDLVAGPRQRREHRQSPLAAARVRRYAKAAQVGAGHQVGAEDAVAERARRLG